jgi:tRNA(His) 5'-end guanylyltransferase
MGARKDKLFRKLARKFDYAKPYERRMASVIKKVYLA